MAGGKAATAVAINDASMHMLRHPFTSILTRLLTSISAVSRILGQSSVEVTLNTYAHFYEERVVKTVDDLNDHLDTLCGIDAEWVSRPKD